jgi:hypothetical protein
MLGIVAWEFCICQARDKNVVEIEAQDVVDAEDAHGTLSLPWLIERDLA